LVEAITMPKRSDVPGLELSVSARNDGTVKAAYIRFRAGKVKRSQEMLEDAVIADYDEHGNILGIEILAPVKVSALTELVDEPSRTSFRRFIKHSGLPRLVHQ
jgi:uncharacterized protein YuzE